jgi:hypothetical protein
MASGKPRFFISYSRTDAAFADRLFAALTGRGNDPWLDRVGLEGGQAFSPELQRQIDQCDCVLALLSPDAIDSIWVNNEIVYALNQRKRIIPLSVRLHKSYLPLASINAIDFTDPSRFVAAMDTLILSYRNLLKPPPPPAPGQPTPPPPPLDYLKFYQDGLTAQTKGDLETALLYWKQILGPEPRYLNGDLATRVQAVEDRLRPIRIENIKRRAQADFQQGQWADLILLLGNLRDLDARSTAAFALDLLHKTADACYRAGRWNDEIAAWDLIRRWQPHYPHADERRQVAITNKSQAPRYVVVRQFLAAGNIDLARSELQALWQSAPYYGDPENLAPKLGLTVPMNIIDRLRQQDAVEAERKAAEVKLETERLAAEERGKVHEQRLQQKRNEEQQALSAKQTREKAIQAWFDGAKKEEIAVISARYLSNSWLFLGVAIILLVITAIEFLSTYSSTGGTSNISAYALPILTEIAASLLFIFFGVLRSVGLGTWSFDKLSFYLSFLFIFFGVLIFYVIALLIYSLIFLTFYRKKIEKISEGAGNKYSWEKNNKIMASEQHYQQQLTEIRRRYADVS